MRALGKLLVPLALVTATVAAGVAHASPGAGLVMFTDDTGQISIGVPSEWGDALTTAIPRPDGTLGPSLMIAPSIDTYLAELGGPGLMLLTTPSPDPAASLDPAWLEAVVTPGCTVATPSAQASFPALPSAIVGTWTCGTSVETTAYGVTSDGVYGIAVAIRTGADDVAAATSMLESLVYAGSDGAPATTAPVETTDLAITDPGDPATAAVLRGERVVGARSTVTRENTITSTAVDTIVDTGTVTTTDETTVFRSTGTNEVLTEEPDGSYTVVFTPTAISGDRQTTKPDESFTGGFAPLVGFPIEVTYGSNGSWVASLAAAGTVPTEEQDSWIQSLPFDGVSLPATPVGVGATWTAPGTVGVGWLFGSFPAMYRLEAIDGDRFTVSMSLTVDLAAIEPDAFTTSMSGTFTRTATIVGSVSTPSPLSITLDESADIAGSFTYGMDSTLRWTSHRSYVEAPA